MNYVFLSGIVATMPSSVELPTKTPLCVFSLKVEEAWVSRDNKQCKRHNHIRIEALGKNAHLASNNLEPGSHINVVGYLRSDSGKVRVRAYTLTSNDKEGVFEGYRKALDQALAIIENSDDIGQIRRKVELLRSEIQNES